MSNIEITVRNNGPLLVRGEGIVIRDADGNVFDLGGRESVSLCRCGQSQNKPFCDGTHKACEFQSVIVAQPLPPPAPKTPPA